MKYAFFALLLANLAFYLWETGVGRSATREERLAAVPAGVERLVLLKELPPAAAPVTPTPPAAPPAAEAAPVTPAPPAAPPAAEAAPDTPAPPPGAESVAGACYQVGPYLSPGRAQSVSRRLAGSLGPVSAVKKPSGVVTGYILLYPSANAEDAQAKLKELRAKGFADAWMIDQGEYRYAVSLAVVHRQERAESAAARYQAQGVAVQVKPRLAPSERWWLKFGSVSDMASLQALAIPPLEAKPCD